MEKSREGGSEGRRSRDRFLDGKDGPAVGVDEDAAAAEAEEHPVDAQDERARGRVGGVSQHVVDRSGRACGDGREGGEVWAGGAAPLLRVGRSCNRSASDTLPVGERADSLPTRPSVELLCSLTVNPTGSDG